jgi:hypothetical protein
MPVRSAPSLVASRLRSLASVRSLVVSRLRSLASVRSLVASPVLVMASVLGACTGVIGDGANGDGGGAPSAANPASPTSRNGDDGGVRNDAGGPALGSNGRYDCGAGPYPATADGRRITTYEYNSAITAIFGGHVAPSTNYPGSYGTSVTGFSTESSISTVGAQSVQQILLAAEDVAQGVAAALPALLPCSKSAPDAACAQTFIDTFARRAYRRTLNPDERKLLLSVYSASTSADPSFSDAIAMVTDAMLQSPQFLYVMEGAAPAARALTSSEVASRLSFMFWDSIPDDTLLALADSDSLTTPASVLAQAQRLVASPNAMTTIARFFREWTGAVEVGPDNKDTTAFPFLTAAYAASMNASFDRFVNGELLDQGTIGSLLLSTDAWVDATMAGFFGVTPPASGQWAKVSLDPSRYTGIMTQPVLMASLAHPAVSSFVLRGKFVRERLLCQELGSPPANAQSLFAMLPIPPNPTGKDVSAAILSNPTCAGCHGLMNPAGLAFENFDGIGRYQAAYPSGKAIDPSGVLPQVGAQGQSLTFANQADLMRQLASQPGVTACYGKQIFRFTLSRIEDAHDACTLQALGDAMAAHGGELASAWMAMTTSDAFLYRIDP